MGLKQKIQDAFAEAQELEQDDPLGNIPKLAQDITDAVVDFLTEQTFTITEMKASLEVEDMKTLTPQQADVLPVVMVQTGVPVVGSLGPGVTTAPGILQGGPKGVLIPPIDFQKKKGLKAVGHAYVGREAAKVPGADTKEEWNNFTKVKLDPNKIKGK